MAKAQKEEPITNVETSDGGDAVDQEQQNVPDSIGLNELAVLAQIVDLATQRGAFRANELTQVGAVYDKLDKFLGFIKQQKEEREAANEESSAETGEK